MKKKTRILTGMAHPNNTNWPQYCVIGSGYLQVLLTWISLVTRKTDFIRKETFTTEIKT